jgi:hypothetical protein
VFAQAGGLLGNGRPASFRRDEEANELVVLFDQLGGGLFVTKLLGKMADLVVKHVGETLEEDERQDVVLKLRGVKRTPDNAGCFPEPGFQGRHIELAAFFSWELEFGLTVVLSHSQRTLSTVQAATCKVLGAISVTIH